MSSYPLIEVTHSPTISFSGTIIWDISQFKHSDKTYDSVLKQFETTDPTSIIEFTKNNDINLDDIDVRFNRADTKNGLIYFN